jgi:hypothetical protein
LLATTEYNGTWDIALAIFKESDNSAAKPQRMLNTTATGNQVICSLALLSNGSLLGVWNVDVVSVRGQLITNIGDNIGSEWTKLTGSGSTIKVPLGVDGFLTVFNITYPSYQIFDNFGKKIGIEVMLSSVPGDGYSLAAIPGAGFAYGYVLSGKIYVKIFNRDTGYFTSFTAPFISNNQFQITFDLPNSLGVVINSLPTSSGSLVNSSGTALLQNILYSKTDIYYNATESSVNSLLLVQII